MTRRKKEDFRREGEKKVSDEILETRYNFHHDKREYKLGEIYTLREREKAIEAEKAALRFKQ